MRKLQNILLKLLLTLQLFIIFLKVMGFVELSWDKVFIPLILIIGTIGTMLLSSVLFMFANFIAMLVALLLGGKKHMDWLKKEMDDMD